MNVDIKQQILDNLVIATQQFTECLKSHTILQIKKQAKEGISLKIDGYFSLDDIYKLATRGNFVTNANGRQIINSVFLKELSDHIKHDINATKVEIKKNMAADVYDMDFTIYWEVTF